MEENNILSLEAALENSSIIEDAPELIQGSNYGTSVGVYAGSSRCNCHSKCQSGSHSKSNSTANSYSVKK